MRSIPVKTSTALALAFLSLGVAGDSTDNGVMWVSRYKK
jgi:hypothetical protein